MPLPDVLSVTRPLNENVVGVDVGVGLVGELLPVHADAHIRNRTAQPRLNIGISAPEWIGCG